MTTSPSVPPSPLANNALCGIEDFGETDRTITNADRPAETNHKHQCLDVPKPIESQYACDAYSASFPSAHLAGERTYMPDIGAAAIAYVDVFGAEVPDLDPVSFSCGIRHQLERFGNSLSDTIQSLKTHNLPIAANLRTVESLVKALLRSPDAAAIAVFVKCREEIKEAVQRLAELESHIGEQQLRCIDRARYALAHQWCFLREELNTDSYLHECASQLQHLLALETFYTQFPLIEQLTETIEKEYDNRFNEAQSARVAAYTKAMGELVTTPGWTDIGEDQQRSMMVMLQGPGVRARVQGSLSHETSIAELRADCDACQERLRSAILEIRRIVDGKRVVVLNVKKHFAGSIDTIQRLDEAIDSFRNECADLISAGMKVVVE